VVIIFPRIEEGRDSFSLSRMDNPARAAQALFNNITEKLAETVVLYDEIPVPGMENSNLAGARLRATQRLARSKQTRLVASVLSSPSRCWGDLLSERYPFKKGAEHGE
jgi:hypothetical protein